MDASTVIVQNVHVGREAFKADLDRYLADRSLTELGWEKPDDLTLLVPMFGVQRSGACDLFLLRLVFDCYPKHPPRAKFVNPITLGFDPQRDISWMPRTAGLSDLGFHVDYQNKGQLICSSMTAEFYEYGHSVQPGHVWVEGQHTFASTLAAIRKGLAPTCYQGRAQA